MHFPLPQFALLLVSSSTDILGSRFPPLRCSQNRVYAEKPYHLPSSLGLVLRRSQFRLLETPLRVVADAQDAAVTVV